MLIISKLQREETYEIFDAKTFSIDEKWKKNSWDDEVTRNLPRDKPRTCLPPMVKIPVREVNHITHCEQFHAIVARGRLGFTAEAKLGRKNSYFKQDTSVKRAFDAALLPGKYSWWGIELPSGFSPPQLEGQYPGLRPILSPLFKPSESIYGTLKIKTTFSELKKIILSKSIS